MTIPVVMAAKLTMYLICYRLTTTRDNSVTVLKKCNNISNSIIRNSDKVHEILLSKLEVWKLRAKRATTEKVSLNLASEASYIYIEWTKVNYKCQKLSILEKFWKSEVCCQTALPDRSLLIGQKLAENANIKRLNATFWVIFKQCVFRFFFCNFERFFARFARIKKWDFWVDFQNTVCYGVI